MHRTRPGPCLLRQLLNRYSRNSHGSNGRLTDFETALSDLGVGCSLTLRPAYNLLVGASFLLLELAHLVVLEHSELITERCPNTH
jgi:hypothetical protein